MKISLKKALGLLAVLALAAGNGAQAQESARATHDTLAGKLAGIPVATDFAQTYSTKFDGEENPLSEGGRWMNEGLDWAKIRKSGGVAYGTETGTNTGSRIYDDSIAQLSGFPPDQEAWGVVHIAKPNASCIQELEILLRRTTSAHNATGYECYSRCINSDKSYVTVVRWDGPIGKYTTLLERDGPDYGLQNGDVLKASIVGNVITVYINGIKKAQVTDDTFKTGSPGIGEWLYCPEGRGIGSNSDYGFSSFTARGIGGAKEAPSAQPQ